MLKINCNFQEVKKRLSLGEMIQLTFDRSDISVRYLEDASTLSLTTPVYFGSNYIPLGVRNSLSHKFSISHPVIKTFLTVNEQDFKIELNYLGEAEFLNPHDFNGIIEEFNAIAEKWRLFLDEKDRNDLIYVKSKR